MPKIRMSVVQIVVLLRQIEAQTGQGKTIQVACREAGISDKNYCRYRKEYGGLDMDHARRLKELEKKQSLNMVGGGFVA